MNKQSKEIIWNLINSFLAGVLVLFGAFTTGDITQKSFVAAAVAGGIVMLSQFKDYWETQKTEYSSTKVIHFIKF